MAKELRVAVEHRAHEPLHLVPAPRQGLVCFWLGRHAVDVLEKARKERKRHQTEDEEAARRNERGRGLAVRLLPNLE